jgi:hypothetical protein
MNGLATAVRAGLNHDFTEPEWNGRKYPATADHLPRLQAAAPRKRPNAPEGFVLGRAQPPALPSW